MKQAIKKEGMVQKAYCLGAGSEIEERMLREGKLKKRDDGTYELFSMEAVNGVGQLVAEGDFFKIDEKGNIHPNGRKWFLEHHRHLGGDEYEQINKPLEIWEAGDPVSEELQYLLDTEQLTLNEADPEKYFNAFLWGAPLSAAKDAVLVFYSVDRKPDGEIEKISFNFVARSAFAQTYRYL